MLNRLRKRFKKSSGKEVAEKLDELGYFRYANPAEVPGLKNEISNAYEAYGMLSTTYTLENGKHYPDDYRLYGMDNENLFGKGAFEKYIREVAPTLEKLNISITVEGEEESFSESKGLNHSISINGTRFTIFKNFKQYSRGGAVATKRFVEIMNKLLAGNSTDELIYPVGSGHHGQLVFLAEEQFRYISAVYPDNQSKPLSLRQWARRNHA